jgi:hypothetical protein
VSRDSLLDSVAFFFASWRFVVVEFNANFFALSLRGTVLVSFILDECFGAPVFAMGIGPTFGWGEAIAHRVVLGATARGSARALFSSAELPRTS